VNLSVVNVDVHVIAALLKMPILRMMSRVPLAISVVCIVSVWLSLADAATQSPKRVVDDLFSSSLFEQQRDPVKSSRNYQNTDGQFTPLSLEQFLADMEAAQRLVSGGSCTRFHQHPILNRLSRPQDTSHYSPTIMWTTTKRRCRTRCRRHTVNT
jgi:hypothetical protein